MLSTKKLLDLAHEKPKKKLSVTNQRAIQSIQKLIQKIKQNNKNTPNQIKVLINKLPNKLRKNNHNLYFLKQKSGYAVQGTGKLSKLKSPHWMTSGTEINGECVTAKVPECASVAKETILSDILQKNVPSKYFISKKKLEHILKQE